MRNIKIPCLKFSKWYKWENKNEYHLKKYPGVYIISITDKNNLEGIQPNLQDVVYVGMTHSQKGLAGRWQQFNSSIKGNGGHSGGNTVYEQIGHYDNWPQNLNLYVAAMGIECDVRNRTADDYISMGWVAYLEYEAFAKFYKVVGEHPRFNTR